ncbi:MAG: nucleoside deaminase [Alphaproteobacteria bacterium]|nr:nucleoside deaminase [Alphaproteobacteria bacterium]
MPPDLFMNEAYKQAEIAFQSNEVPVGAVITYQSQIIAKQYNETLARTDPTAHAEILAVREACQKLGTERLVECSLYVTLEPCPMCAQAISFARIKALYFGAYDPKGGGIEHGPRIFEQSTCHHKPEIWGGIQEDVNAELLQAFFAERR